MANYSTRLSRIRYISLGENIWRRKLDSASQPLFHSLTTKVLEAACCFASGILFGLHIAGWMLS